MRKSLVVLSGEGIGAKSSTVLSNNVRQSLFKPALDQALREIWTKLGTKKKKGKGLIGEQLPKEYSEARHLATL